MPRIYYAQARGENIADGLAMSDNARNEIPEIWHLASLDGECFYPVSKRPATVADYESLAAHVNQSGTIPLSLGRDLVERFSREIEEIEV